jgi:hypothetical protein
MKSIHIAIFIEMHAESNEYINCVEFEDNQTMNYHIPTTENIELQLPVTYPMISETSLTETNIYNQQETNDYRNFPISQSVQSIHNDYPQSFIYND